MKTLTIIIVAVAGVATSCLAQNDDTAAMGTALTATENSPDYKAGFTKGYSIGVQFANDGNARPQGSAISVMARNWQAREAPRSTEDWKGGFIAGFWKGFDQAPPAKR